MCNGFARFDCGHLKRIRVTCDAVQETPALRRLLNRSLGSPRCEEWTEIRQKNELCPGCKSDIQQQEQPRTPTASPSAMSFRQRQQSQVTPDPRPNIGDPTRHTPGAIGAHNMFAYEQESYESFMSRLDENGSDHPHELPFLWGGHHELGSDPFAPDSAGQGSMTSLEWRHPFLRPEYPRAMSRCEKLTVVHNTPLPTSPGERIVSMHGEIVTPTPGSGRGPSTRKESLLPSPDTRRRSSGRQENSTPTSNHRRRSSTRQASVPPSPASGQGESVYQSDSASTFQSSTVTLWPTTNATGQTQFPVSAKPSRRAGPITPDPSPSHRTPVRPPTRRGERRISADGRGKFSWTGGQLTPTYTPENALNHSQGYKSDHHRSHTAGHARAFTPKHSPDTGEQFSNPRPAPPPPRPVRSPTTDTSTRGHVRSSSDHPRDTFYSQNPSVSDRRAPPNSFSQKWATLMPRRRSSSVQRDDDSTPRRSSSKTSRSGRRRSSEQDGEFRSPAAGFEERRGRSPSRRPPNISTTRSGRPQHSKSDSTGDVPKQRSASLRRFMQFPPFKRNSSVKKSEQVPKSPDDPNVIRVNDDILKAHQKRMKQQSSWFLPTSKSGTRRESLTSGGEESLRESIDKATHGFMEKLHLRRVSSDESFVCVKSRFMERSPGQ